MDGVTTLFETFLNSTRAADGRRSIVAAIWAIHTGNDDAQQHLAEHGGRAVRDHLRTHSGADLDDAFAANGDLDDDEIDDLITRRGDSIPMNRVRSDKLALRLAGDGTGSAAAQLATNSHLTPACVAAICELVAVNAGRDAVRNCARWAISVSNEDRGRHLISMFGPATLDALATFGDNPFKVTDPDNGRGGRATHLLLQRIGTDINPVDAHPRDTALGVAATGDDDALDALCDTVRALNFDDQLDVVAAVLERNDVDDTIGVDYGDLVDDSGAELLAERLRSAAAIARLCASHPDADILSHTDIPDADIIGPLAAISVELVGDHYTHRLTNDSDAARIIAAAPIDALGQLPTERTIDTLDALLGAEARWQMFTALSADYTGTVGELIASIDALDATAA